MKVIPVIILCSSILLSACSTQVTSLSVDRDTGLEGGKGYLFMTVDTNVNLNSIEIRGAKTVRITSDDLHRGSNHILFELPSGNYKFHKISKKFDYFILKNKSEYWSFSIADGAISYVGKLEAKSHFFLSASFELLNQSSVALEYLEENFPNILRERKVVYSGPGEDRFLEYVNDK